MSSFEALTEAELAEYRLNSEFLRYLEAFRNERGLQKHQVRVLDWGCGRGQATILLERLGYDVMGADIDEVSIRNGRAFYGDPKAGTERLRLLDAGGRLDVPDGTFDFVFSETVLEHIADLDAVVRELHRLMATPSSSLHVFPARRGIVEDHLYMPFIHWLPKNRLRKWAMYPYVALGVEPHWEEESLRAKVQRYYDYSLQHTFYRRPQDLRRAFAGFGFEVDFVAARHPRVANHALLGPLARVATLRQVLDAGLTHFRIVELLARKPASQTRP